MEFWKFMFVPTILFLVIVAPMWITMHYRSVSRSSRSLTREDRESIEHMLETVDKLTDPGHITNFIEHIQHGLVGPSMRRTPQCRYTCSNTGIRVGTG